MPRRALPWLFASALTSTAPAVGAGGWHEAHQTSDDVRIAVGSDGVATFEHKVRYRIVAGRFKALDVPGIDPRAVLVTETVAVTEKGGEIAARVEPDSKASGTVKVAFDDPKGLSRGFYVLTVKYKLDLVAEKMLVKDGAMWRLVWSAPAASQGRDGARVVFELPPAPTEPRLAAPEQAQTTLSTLRRQADRDELELVRAHVPRGEVVVWSARVDPKAFPKIVAPELKPRVLAEGAPSEGERPRVAILVLAFASLAGLLAFALRSKQAWTAAETAARGAVARPLVRVPWGLGPYAYGVSASGALAALLWGTPLHGAILAVVAMALALHRAPSRPERPRGPGRWAPICDEEVLVGARPTRRPGDPLDPGTNFGRLSLVVVASVVAAAAFALRGVVPGADVAIPLASSVLVPLFATGTRAQMPRTPEELAARFLRPTRDVLGVLVDLAHVELGCLARLRERTREVDEVRLACAPGDRIPGVRAIELALATGGPEPLPEVLVRFDEGSAAAAKIAEVAPGLPIVPGRCPEERVLRLRPSLPTASASARLLARLLFELEGRRATDRARPAPRYEGPERRGPFSRLHHPAAATP